MAAITAGVVHPQRFALGGAEPRDALADGNAHADQGVRFGPHQKMKNQLLFFQVKQKQRPRLAGH